MVFRYFYGIFISEIISNLHIFKTDDIAKARSSDVKKQKKPTKKPAQKAGSVGATKAVKARQTATAALRKKIRGGKVDTKTSIFLEKHFLVEKLLKNLH